MSGRRFGNKQNEFCIISFPDSWRDGNISVETMLSVQTMPKPDNLLIAEFNTQRSEEAFAALVQQHVNLVFATALRQVGERGAAEEITQSVFVALAQSSGKLGSHPTIAGWLHRATVNKSREWLRSELRRRHRERVAVNLQSVEAEGDSVWSALTPLLDEALLELPESDRLAVIMRFMEGHTFHELGSALGIGEDAARKRINRCLDRLTGFFRRHGFAVEGTSLISLPSQAAPMGLAASATAAGVAAAHSAASTPVLTLIRGAFKLSAWTKAQTASVVGTGVLLAAGTVTVAVHVHGENRVVWALNYEALENEPPVVLIRPWKTVPGQSAGWYKLSSGKVIALHQPMAMMLSHAFGIQPTRIVGPFFDGFYDYLVSVPTDQELALQKAVRERFGLVGRLETREVDVLRLTRVRAEADRLRVAQKAQGSSRDEPGMWVFRGVHLGALAQKLEEALGTPVIDGTGLSNVYDIDFTFAGRPFSLMPLAALRQAAQEQLGLELVPTRESITVLVVERVRAEVAR
jgi:uncharacterized protein (TIGR03435 family)